MVFSFSLIFLVLTVLSGGLVSVSAAPSGSLFTPGHSSVPNAASSPVLEARGIHSLCRKYRQYYNVSSMEMVLDVPHLVSAQEVVGCKGGCSLGYNQGSSMTISAAVTILPGLTAGAGTGGASQPSITTSFGVTIAHGTTEAVVVNIGCPAGARCGLQARPILARVQGITSWHPGKHTCLHPPVESFDVYFPLRAEGYAKHVTQARVTYSGCFIPGFGPKVRDPDFDYPFCPDSLNPSGSKSVMAHKE